jgi:zinc/manganese transport system substrate-binding protein
VRTATPAQRGSLSLAVVLLVASALAGCGATTATTANGKLVVVAAENFWGSIAAQLGGDKVVETSIISKPNVDPHSYEPTAADARSLAGAQLVIVNGLGYDAWVPHLLAANPVNGRLVLDVGRLVNAGSGANPHRWYSPGDVAAVIHQIAADYRRLDARDASYFAARETRYLQQGLGEYTALIASIRSRFAGTPVGASESIFAPLAQALNLDLITPAQFLAAVSEGAEPTAADKATIDRQIAGGQIKVFVYNRQNATPDVQALVSAARARGIPVTSITETLSPATATFQDWQVAQLRALAAALARATGH